MRSFSRFFSLASSDRLSSSAEWWSGSEVTMLGLPAGSELDGSQDRLASDVPLGVAESEVAFEMAVEMLENELPVCERSACSGIAS